MRNSMVLWLLSGLVSVGAHAGTLAALSQISLPRLEDQRNTELLVTSTAFDDLFQTEVASTISTPVVSTKSAAEITETKEKPSEDLAPETGDTVAALATDKVEAAASDSLGAKDSATANALAGEGQTDAVNDAAIAAPAESSPLATANNNTATPPLSSETRPTIADASSVPPQSSDGAVAASSAAVAASGEGNLLAPDSATILAATLPANDDIGPPVTSATTLTAQPPANGDTGPPITSAPAAATAGQELNALPAGTVMATRGTPSSAPVRKGETLVPIEAAPAVTAKPEQTAAATAIAGPALSQAERIREFLKAEGNRPCLYAKPGNLNAGRPTFTGFSGGSGRTSEFASEFQKSVGVDPRLLIRTVVEAQCPAVDFIRTLRAASPKEVAVIIDNQAIADYGNLIGHLEGDLGEHVLLLLVDDDGAVQDISAKLHRKGDKNVFAERAILRGPGSKSRYQMLLALSSSKPFAITTAHVAGEAVTVFATLTAQARQGERDLALGIASFKVD